MLTCASRSSRRVVHDAEQEAREHKPDGDLRVDARPPRAVGA
jgi:hypothetical protein